MSRKLLSTRRTVASCVPEYLRAFEQLRLFVEEAGAHAWLFHSDSHPHLYNEFIEWKQRDDEAPLTALPRLTELRQVLAQFGPSSEDSWTQP